MQLLDNKIMWFRFGRAVCTCPLSYTIGFYAHLCIYYDLSNRLIIAQPPIASETARSNSEAILVKLSSPNKVCRERICMNLLLDVLLQLTKKYCGQQFPV